ncbi:LTA synthase family protein [Variovorax paradoxus]|nr:LTA synthase family protein [Variovorax paradoxus]
MRQPRLKPTATQPQAKDPWRVAGLLLLPLALWLGLAKTALVMNAIFAVPVEGSGWGAWLQWLWWFTSLRILAAVLLGVAIQRVVSPKHRWAAAPIAVAVLVAFALMFPVPPPDDSLVRTLQVWFYTARIQVFGLAACLWRDLVSLAIAVFAFGLVLVLSPARARRGAVLVLQLLVLLSCAVVGIDWAYQFAVGQPASSRVLWFALFNMQDIAPLVAPEASVLRVLAIGGGICLAAAWAWRQRALAATPLLPARRSYAAGIVAFALALAVVLPQPAHGVLALLRHTEGTLITLAKTAAPTPMHGATAKVAREFAHTGKPRWYSASMLARQTDMTKRKNVVIVMLESMRAESTTVHNPGIETTPFMSKLARKSLVVNDMSAVIPRTAAAWMAVLGGQYPLANEGTQRWALENRKQARIRTLPSILREAGYATSFFTPTTLKFQSDLDVIDTFRFEYIRTEQELANPESERVTYFGIADEWMVQPILDWTAAKVDAGQPFFTAIMTNVGHHNFETPSTWHRISFDGVSNRSLESYYNCLRYIDGVLAKLMEGYGRLGVLDDTVFVFVGDHGQMFDEHGAKQIHNAVYQEGLHVPALIYAPGMLAPGIVRGPRQQIDILPTVVELLGLRIDGAQLPGESLLHAVDPERRLYYSSSIDWSFLSARRGQRKYVYSFERDPIEVFDLDKDPKELAALRDVDPGELASVREDLLEWRMNAELAMLARPADGNDPSLPWVSR